MGILDYMAAYADFMFGWIPELLAQAFAFAIEWLTVAYFKLANVVMVFAWDTAQVIIADLQLSQHVNTAWTALTVETRSILAFFRIPECINILTSFAMTKFVLKFVPFF